MSRLSRWSVGYGACCVLRRNRTAKTRPRRRRSGSGQRARVERKMDDRDRLRAPPPTWRERLGLSLARLALVLTRNRRLADASRVLPLIPSRQFALCVDGSDLHWSRILTSGHWVL